MGLLSYQLAYDAIEEYVAEKFPNDQGTWQQIVPSKDWGYTEEGWESAASDIVRRFNRRLPAGQNISVPPSAKRNLLDKPLVEFRRYLAAKADEISAAPLISVVEH